MLVISVISQPVSVHRIFRAVMGSVNKALEKSNIVEWASWGHVIARRRKCDNW